MALTTLYIICIISIANYMYSLSECFRSESNSEPLRWNIRWIFLRKFSRVRPVNYFVKNSISDVQLSLNTTLKIAIHN